MSRVLRISRINLTLPKRMLARARPIRRIRTIIRIPRLRVEVTSSTNVASALELLVRVELVARRPVVLVVEVRALLTSRCDGIADCAAALRDVGYVLGGGVEHVLDEAVGEVEEFCAAPGGAVVAVDVFPGGGDGAGFEVVACDKLAGDLEIMNCRGRWDVPLLPAMTTSNSSRNCPLLVTASGESGSPYSAHLMLVVEAGFGQPGPGSARGSRSKYMLNATVPGVSLAICEHRTAS